MAKKKQLFTAEQFTPLQTFYTSKDKAKCANDFVRFVESGFKETLFTKSLYAHLSSMWGHIAHYNIWGFYAEWFSDKVQQCSFLERCIRTHPIGDPAFTRCDIERVLAEWVRTSGHIERLNREIAEEVSQRERAQLRRLAAKYPGEVIGG